MYVGKNWGGVGGEESGEARREKKSLQVKMSASVPCIAQE